MMGIKRGLEGGLGLSSAAASPPGVFGAQFKNKLGRRQGLVASLLNDPKRSFSIWCRFICWLGFFAKTFDVGFGLIWCLVDVLADLRNVLVLPCRLYIDHKALPVGCADDPPIRESRIGNSDNENDCQQNSTGHWTLARERYWPFAGYSAYSPSVAE